MYDVVIYTCAIRMKCYVQLCVVSLKVSLQIMLACDLTKWGCVEGE